MDIAKQAEGIVADAERRLQELVGAAAATRDYGLAMRLTRWAQALSAIARNGGESPAGNASAALLGLSGADSKPPLPPVAEVQQGTSGASRSRGPGQPARRRTAATRGRESRRAPAKGEYPKFFRQGDFLVKIGWSKKAHSEYEHKAPRRVIELLAEAIGRKGGHGKLFTSEDVLPLRDPPDGGEVPGYQGYVALAWFKAAGFIKQNGRRGYTAQTTSRLPESVASRWERLLEAKD
ncbi:MAG TPA: hypothetical protein PKK06_17685 [Phycisphaerae bacterium]|nr:hypothetical protein [Phycisphaerae bacterium]